MSPRRPSLTQALGRVLTKERERAGESPTQYARRLGFDPRTYRRLEAGTATVRVSTLDKLARGLVVRLPTSCGGWNSGEGATAILLSLLDFNYCRHQRLSTFHAKQTPARQAARSRSISNVARAIPTYMAVAMGDATERSRI
jgi:transcriptional regulator with XRE-family HTH domain